MKHLIHMFLNLSGESWMQYENHLISLDVTFFITVLFLFLMVVFILLFYTRNLKKDKRTLQEEVSKRSRDMDLQKEELQTQIEFSTIQNHKIERQNQELRKHRQNLEELVKKRTKDLEEAKRRAEESDRLKSAFLANMSHEIRTPMNAIIGFSNILYEDNLTGEEQRELLTHINDNTHHLLKLIENIIDISKIEANEMEFKYKPVNLNYIFDEIYNDYKEFNDFKNQTLVLDINKQYDDRNVYIQTDPWRLKQIVCNLIDNSIKFTNTGKIEFGYRILEVKPKRTLEFYVKDTGIGISKDQQKHIYEVFRKIEDNHADYSEGTGIGLSICKKLVEGLEGNLWVESTPGKGSIFYFTLPFIEATKFAYKD